MSKRFHVILKAASEQPYTILNKLNAVSRDASMCWDVSITHNSGDATRLTKEPEADGVDVVEADGAEGTAMVLPQGVMDAEVPMALLAGGTAKVLPKVLPILTSRKQGVA